MSQELLKRVPSVKIVGLDNINDYYEIVLKIQRLRDISATATGIMLSDVENGFTAGNFTFVLGNLADKAMMMQLFEKHHFDVVVNLAAQAGVRYSIDHPDVYIESNLIGFYNILGA